MTFYLFGAVVVAGAVAAASSLYRALHMLQLEGYRTERYLRHGWEARSWRTFVPLATLLATLGAGVVALVAGSATAEIAVILAGIAEAAAFTWRVWSRPSKVPIKITARMRRLIATSVVLSAAVVGAKYSALAVIGSTIVGGASPLLAYTAAGVIVVAGPIMVVLSAWLLEPLEMALRRGFVEQARKRLAEVDPIVIGVAGSYGKTTTKAALVAALSGRYRVLATPESYNTLLGVTRTINEQLADDTEVFIVEMGARHPGDIEEISRLVKPTVGVVTSLGPQHLEYFKSEDAVVRTKTELLRALPSDGLAIVDADGISAFEGPHEWQARTIRVSARDNSGAEAIVGDIALGGDGTSFTVRRADAGTVEVRTPLLGRHVAMNCGLAVVTGLELGVCIDSIREGLARMKPVPHRLEIVRNDSVVVIDDAFNSNPEGFSAALEVLAAIPGRHILITPGMIELGEQTVEAHRRVARVAAASCDIVILVGRVYPPQFAQALLDGGIGADTLHKVDTLAAASELLGTMIGAGDVVLFENDLPDNFE